MKRLTPLFLLGLFSVGSVGLMGADLDGSGLLGSAISSGERGAELVDCLFGFEDNYGVCLGS